ncbi:glycoside hydrolase family 76 protein [Chitinophaga tropicalis]|nr:glycoside hydrolase family 76 protein [Chitinophaga tropicalis]
MKHLFTLILVLLLTQSRSYAQSSTFSPVADALQTSLYNTYGVPNQNYWWCAHGLDVLVDGYIRTRSTTYTTRMKALLYGIRSFNGNTYINHFYDDMEWLGIACLRAYLATEDAEYLTVANTLWTDIKTGYSSNAINWNKSCPGCKNACANGPAVILAARLYRITGVAADLDYAKNIFAFMKANLVDPVTGAVWDAIDLNTGVTNKDWIFSYNVGTYIGAGLELYKVTGDVTYLNEAVKTAEYAMNSRRPNGMFFGDEQGGGDGGLFKGIFIRYFYLLAREGNISADARARYYEALRYNAHTLKNKGINSSTNLVSANWMVQPSGIPDYSIQLSGVKMIETAATLDQVFLYKDINYGGSSWPLTTGSYNTSALVAKKVKDNDITSYTIPANTEVSFFKNDNFGGDELTVTSNNAWIGHPWNDSISSLTINSTAPAGVATFYKDCFYTGAAVTLEAGNYTLAQLIARGIIDNDISSLEVNSGYQVILYDGDNFSGGSVTRTVNTGCLVQDGDFNDKTTSLKIQPLGILAAPQTLAQHTGETNKTGNLIIYPNPVGNDLYIRAGTDLSGAIIYITDVSGKRVLQTRLTANRIDVSRLKAGIYWLSVQKNGKVYNMSFIK